MDHPKLLLKGKPRTFTSGDQFLETVIDYIRVCENEFKQYPNIAGFCSFVGICRDTFYQQKEYYPDAYKKAQEVLENIAINSRNASDTMKIFYLKNKFQYRNNIDETVKVEKKEEEFDFSRLSNDELLLLLGLLEKSQ